MAQQHPQSIESRLAFIEKKIDILMANQSKLKEWIVGDDDNELNVGALTEIMTLKQKVEKLEKIKEKALWIIVGMSLPAGAGIARLLEILKHT